MNQQKLYNPVRLSREELHKTYGGLVLESEFDTDYIKKESKVSYWATKIIANWKFDKYCKMGCKHV